MEDLGPSRSWYVIAAILFLACGIAVPAYVGVGLVKAMSSGEHFVAPGSVAIEVGEPGGYVVWSEVNAIHDGQLYPGGFELPEGLDINVREAASGKRVEYFSVMSATENSGNWARWSVCGFEAARPGRYEVEVAGDFEERVFCVRQTILARYWLKILAAILLGGLGLLGGPGLALLVFIKRYGARQKARLAASRDSSSSPSPSSS